MSFLDPVARIEREHAANTARVDDFKAKVETLKASLHGNADFDTLDQADEAIAVLERKLTLAEGVAANSAERLAAAKAEADKKAEADEKRKLDREAEAGTKRLRAMEALIFKLRDERVWLADIDARCAAAGVMSVEERVRRGPSRTLPAITETKLVWFGPDGTRYGSDMMTDNEGRWVKATDRVQREVVDVIREEMTLPGEMPERLTDALHLVDLQGRSL